MAEILELQKKDRPALSGWPMLLFFWAMILCALHASTHMVGAGDTWVAMACGRHFINHGVDTVEPFSANSHRPGPTVEEVEHWPGWAQKITETVGFDTVKYWHPTGWVNQNWLTHVIFYWVTHESPIADAETFAEPIAGQDISYDSLVYWKYALYIITVLTVYYMGRHLGANAALSAVFACFAIFVGRTFFDIRPAGFSNVLTAVLLFIFILTINRHYLYIWLMVPVTVLWCNLHGGYIYVFIVLVPFLGLHFLRLLPKRAALTILYIFGWLFLYALAYKFRSHKYLESIDMGTDAVFKLLLVFVGVRAVLPFVRNAKNSLICVYDVLISLLIFLTTVSKFYPGGGIEKYIRGDNVFAGYVHEGRLTFYVAFIGIVVVGLLLAVFRKNIKSLSWKGWVHGVGASAVTLIAIIIFNPFHLTNITHTFIVTLSENAKLWKTVNEWHPAFEWSNPVGDEIPFLIMYIITWLVFAFWITTLILRPKAVSKGVRAGDKNFGADREFQWPRIDLPLLAVAAMTIYMAIGSRRFIPVAAIAACPILAMFIDDGVKIISALYNLKLEGVLRVGRMPKFVQRWLISAAIVIVVFLTVWWGYWYYAIYVGPWPDNGFLDSVFMRMTASYAKPFKACQFIRDNELSGKMFNYWTEGGFIAYGQVPDAETGKTPLQLFMDGRAQAAYDTAAYQRWMEIMSGGPPARIAKRAGRKITVSDYVDIGNWIAGEFKKEDVWVTLMPAAQFNSALVRGLEYNNNWRVVFINDSQQMMVDVTTAKGLKLYSGLSGGQTKFPDEYSKNLTLAHNFLKSKRRDYIGKGFDYARRAFALNESQMAVLELVNAAKRDSSLRGQVVAILKDFLNDFAENKSKLKKQSGYQKKTIAALMVSNYLSKADVVNKIRYEKLHAELFREQARTIKRSRW